MPKHRVPAKHGAEREAVGLPEKGRSSAASGGASRPPWSAIVVSVGAGFAALTLWQLLSDAIGITAGEPAVSDVAAALAGIGAGIAVWLGARRA
jgi:hypothetical protein